MVVFGGSIPGVCAALSAARSGAKVSLVARDSQLGGMHLDLNRFPLALPHESLFPLGRESGVYEEVFGEILYENREGDYSAIGRALENLVRAEKNISLFKEHHLVEAQVNQKSAEIKSALVIGTDLLKRKLFRARFFIDCSVSSEISKLAGACERIEGSSPLEPSILPNPKLSRRNHALNLVVAKADSIVTFSCPTWVSCKWEDNFIEGKLDLLESLNQKLAGDHLVEWQSETQTQVGPEDIAYCAWDFLKNRSPFRKILDYYYLKGFSSEAVSTDTHRGQSLHDLNLKDLAENRSYEDSIALGAIPVSEKPGPLFSSRGKKGLSHPFEIPLRSLRSAKIKNLFWIGDNACSQSGCNLFSAHAPTLSMMSSACGVATALLSRSNESMDERSLAIKVRKSLSSNNQQVGFSSASASKNLSPAALVSASSYLRGFVSKHPDKGEEILLRDCLIQFPVIESFLEKVEVCMGVSQDADLEIKLFEGSSFQSLLPGRCLFGEIRSFPKDQSDWKQLTLNCAIEKPGWHFLQIRAAEEFSLSTLRDSPVGVRLLLPVERKHRKNNGGSRDYVPPKAEACSPGLSIGPLMRTHPEQNAYAPENVVNSFFRSTEIPNLWISQATDFKYPEFLELSWEEKVALERIDISFDGSFQFTGEVRPQSYEKRVIPSIAKDYNIYYTDENDHSQMLLEVRNNRQTFRRHLFDPVNTNSIEIEILSTHGLNRAQIFQVRAFAENSND